MEPSSKGTHSEEGALPCSVANSEDIGGQGASLRNQRGENPAILSSGLPAPLKRNGSQKASHHIQSSTDNAVPSSSTGPRSKNGFHEIPPEIPQVRRSQSDLAKGDIYCKSHPSSRIAPFSEEYTNMENQNHKLRQRIKEFQSVVSSLENSLAETKACNASVQERLDEATATIFRLRPQRQEPTESSVEEYYQALTSSIRNWIDSHCESFLDANTCGFDIFGNDSGEGSAQPELYETIFTRFRSQSSRWVEAKELILAAVIMRFLYEEILTRPLSALLDTLEQDFLAGIYQGMQTLEPKKDLITIRTWRSDTLCVINKHDKFTSRYSELQRCLSGTLYGILQPALLNNHDAKVAAYESLSKDIIVPAIEFSQKVQSATSIWSIKYSMYHKSQPGQFASKLPKFLATIQDFRCINLSANFKYLKPAIDLEAKEQQEALQYVLDIFPGLYCQRVTAGATSPVSTMSQPVLLVTFAVPQTPKSHDHKEAMESKVSNHEQLPGARPASKGLGVLDTVRGLIGGTSRR